MDNEFLIITGMSGAGKSVAVRALEDVGFYCIDNMPLQLVPQLLEPENRIDVDGGGVACVIDIRAGDSISRMSRTVNSLKEKAGCRVVFLDAQDSVLLARYKETRRVHPVMMQTGLSLDQAIERERDLLSSIYEDADYVVDTTLLSTSQLKEKILSFVMRDEKDSMTIEVMSFGYKYGVPSDADLVFDVRCLKNPFYVPELKDLTGNDREVSDYVFSDENAEKLLKAQKDLIDLSVPLYIKEGKGHLTIGYGCTGGNHRSVSFANRMKDHLERSGYTCSVHHRDLDRRK